ncbi:MAG: hypothetical protein D3916_17115, partial [Candidatus Electrothrix sp. MAN1_4]|nr:hypothetical protein [Candidatus Electrothrix sp. MAN1_4]
MFKKMLVAFITVLFVITPGFAAQENTMSDDEVRIGILSWRGPLGFTKRWEATEEYLTQAIDRPVTIIPLEFEDVLPAVKSGELDFFTADPSMFISAKMLYGASEVLTMKLSNADSVGA